MATDTGDLLLLEAGELKCALAASPADGASIDSIVAYSKGFVCGTGEGCWGWSQGGVCGAGDLPARHVTAHGPRPTSNRPQAKGQRATGTA